MLKYIKRKIGKAKLKKKFNEYGFKVKKFQIPNIGTIQYAQWLHPLEKPKEITASNILFYQQLSKKGGMIIDIGAHTGDTTIPMARAVGKDGLVLGIEPNQYVFKILEKNARLNSDQLNIVPLCFAATAKAGKFVFHYSDASFCNGGFLQQIRNQRYNHNFPLEVVGKNLQDYLLQEYKDNLVKLDLIKIDAEGYDKEILKTIPKILESYQPNLLVECYKKLNVYERNELFDVLNRFDYNMYFLENFNVFDELKEIKKSDMSKKKHFEILAVHKSKKL